MFLTELVKNSEQRTREVPSIQLLEESRKLVQIGLKTGEVVRNEEIGQAESW